MELKKRDPEIATTTFVNVDDEPYDIYIKGTVVRHFEAGEQDKIVFYIAQVGAKHLVDKILQKKGVPDSNRDTPERQDLFSRILPEVTEELGIKPMTDEEWRASVDKRLAADKNERETEYEKRGIEKADDRKEIEDLKKQLAELKKVGRPSKTT